MAFRNQHPDEATEKEVLKELKDKKIDVSELVDLRGNHCQHMECQQTKEVPHRDTDYEMERNLPGF